MACAQIASAILAADKTIILGESLGFWIQTGAFVLSAIAAVCVIWQSSISSRRRATIDLILSQAGNTELTKAITEVYKLHESNVRFVDIKPETPEHEALKQVLNYLEFVALGIRRKAFDGVIYKELKYSDIMRIWDSCQSYVAEIRRMKNKCTLFQELEWLVNTWGKTPLKKLKK